MRSIWIWAVAAVVVAGCHCGKQPLSQQGPEFVVTAPTTRLADGGYVLDFGTVIEPGSYTGLVSISNQGLLLGNIQSAQLRAGSDPAFSLATATYPAPVKPGNAFNLTVNYAPTKTESAVGYVDLTTDDSHLPAVTVKLIAASQSDQALVCVDASGDGGWQCNTPSAPPLVIDFGTVLVGNTVTRNVQVRDVGTGTLQYYGTSFGASTPLAYTMAPAQVEPAGGLGIDAGSQIQFAIVYAPTSAGLGSGVASVNTSDSTNPRVDIQLNAHGVSSTVCSLQVSPTPLNFGSVPNNAPADQALVVVNVGAQPCHISGLPLSGSTAFTLPSPPTLPDMVPVNGVVTLTVEYAPSGTNVDNGTLTIQSDDPVNPNIAVPLQATSIVPPPCVVSATPSSLDFGALTPGSHLVKNVTLLPNGSDLCTIVSAKIRHGDPAYSTIASLPMVLVQADAGIPIGTNSGTIGVSYGPTAPGTDSDTLDLTYLAGISLNSYVTSVPLHGVSGVQQLCIVPTALHYGAVPVGQSKDLAFAMTACGNTTVHISSLAVEPTGTPFTLPAPGPTLPLIIPLGTTVDQTVRFTPPTSTPYTAKVHVVSDDPAFPDQYVALDTQPETACVLKITPISVNFGQLAANQVAQKNIVLSNIGSGVCHLTNIALTAAAAGFSLIGAPATLDIPFGTSAPPLVVQANLPPGNPTTRAGKVTFGSNDATQPNVVIPVIAYLPSNGPYAQGWPKLYADNSNTSRTIADTSSVTGRELWTFSMPPAGTSFGPNPCPTYQQSPTVGPDGTVYQVDIDGTLNALNPDGTLRWQYTSLSPAGVDPFGATPFIAADGGIYFASGSEGTSIPEVFHVSSTGTLLAKGDALDAGADGFDGAPLLSSQGNLFIFDDFPGMVVMSPTTLGLEEVKGVNYGDERGSFALAPDDTSFWNFGSLAQRVTPPAPPNGGMSVTWSWPPAGSTPFGGAIAIGGDIAVDSTLGRVYLAAGWLQNLVNMSTGVTAVDINSGAVLWSKLLPAGPATANALGAISQLWTTDTGNCSPSIGSDGTVYIGNVDGMYALDGPTGGVKAGWPYHTSSAVTGSASIGGDGALFFGTSDGTFYALNADGSLRFKQATGGRISSSPAIGPDGTVFFVSDDGLLHAIH